MSSKPQTVRDLRLRIAARRPADDKRSVPRSWWHENVQNIIGILTLGIIVTGCIWGGMTIGYHSERAAEEVTAQIKASWDAGDIDRYHELREKLHSEFKDVTESSMQKAQEYESTRSVAGYGFMGFGMLVMLALWAREHAKLGHRERQDVADQRYLQQDADEVSDTRVLVEAGSVYDSVSKERMAELSARVQRWRKTVEDCQLAIDKLRPILARGTLSSSQVTSHNLENLMKRHERAKQGLAAVEARYNEEKERESLGRAALLDMVEYALVTERLGKEMPECDDSFVPMRIDGAFEGLTLDAIVRASVVSDEPDEALEELVGCAHEAGMLRQ